MAEPVNPKHRTWSKQRLFAEAVRRVLDENWSQAEAAKYFGVSRPRLNEHIKRERAKLAEEEAVADETPVGPPDSQGGAGPLGLQERRRVGTFEEFDDYYWGRWSCPDCGRHHARPDFHSEIMSALGDSDPRLVINMPPYHAKSTLVTVKHSVYKLVANPNHRRIIISKSLGFAKEFLHAIDALLTNPELYLGGPSIIEDWGPFKSDSQGETVWNTEKIYVAGRVTPEKDPTIKVLGVNGQIYGSRADDIVADDVATLENQRNPARVGQMLEWFDKEVSSRIGANGKLIYVGTRVHPGDIYSTLQHRPGYRVLRYPLIRQEPSEVMEAQMLWGDHFGYEMAQVKRAEMRDADFQLVYQNIDTPGLGASFTQEMLDDCKDPSRVVGHFESDWRLIAGLDLAGGNQGSGYTAGVLIGIDLRTGKRFLVDLFNEKSMRAPRLKEKILEWTDRYPIYTWRVENNGLQSNLVQYNEEIVRALAQKGVRIEPHNTQGNKWDPEFGVESIAPLYSAGLISIPWGNAPTCRHFQQLIDQLLVFPMGMVSDLAMSAWFAELGCRDLLRRAHLPMFDSRMHVPERIKRRRVIVNFENQEVRNVPRHLQGEAAFSGAGARGYRRLTVGRPQSHRDAVEQPAPEPTPFVNVAGSVEDEHPAA